MVFEQGYGISNIFDAAYGVSSSYNEIRFRIMESFEQGYVYVCNQYADQCVNRKHTTLAPFPDLQTFLNSGGIYIDPTFRPETIRVVSRVHIINDAQKRYAKRYFSAVVPLVGFGYFDSVEALFMAIKCYGTKVYNNLEVQEYWSLEDARYQSFRKYKWHIQRMVGYLVCDINFPADLPVNDFYFLNNQVREILPPFFIA